MTLLAIDPWDVLQWALSMTGLLALITAIVIYVKGAAREATIKMLQESNAVRDIKIGDLSSTVTELKTENTGLRQTVRVLENIANSGDKIDALRGDVIELIQAMHEALGTHHSVAIEHMDTLHTDVAGLPFALAKVLKEMK